MSIVSRTHIVIQFHSQQNMRALQFQEDRKVMKSFLQWYAYIDECKRERFRKDYRLSALAVSHFKSVDNSLFSLLFAC